MDLRLEGRGGLAVTMGWKLLELHFPLVLQFKCVPQQSRFDEMVWSPIPKGKREQGEIADQKSGHTQGEEGKSECGFRTGGGGREVACRMIAADIVGNDIG